MSLKATRVIIDKLKSNGTLHQVGADFGGYWEIADEES